MAGSRKRISPTRRRIHAAALKLFVEQGATKLSVSDLAAAAGVARGTIYNNLPDPDALFPEVAANLVHEMSVRITHSFAGIDDPAERIAHAIRHYVRRTHEEPNWARFMTQFAYNSESLQRLWVAGPGDNLKSGIKSGRYAVRREQVRAVLGMVAGAVIGAMIAVLDGDLTWRSAGSDTAELLLVALGLDREEARTIATLELPPLPPLP